MQLFLTHSKPNFHFTKNYKDFKVEEKALYDFDGSGEHLIIKVRKKGLTTWELIRLLSAHTGVKAPDFGYAGLKDKEGETIQYISLPKKAQPEIETFSHEAIKILDTTYHKNKIKIGHLKGNNFKIRLKKVMSSDATILAQAMNSLANFGMPNYFGYQRFGNEKQNHEIGKQIVLGEKKEKNRKLKELYLNAWQSFIFNEWLSNRILISNFARDFKKQELADALATLNQNIDTKKMAEYLANQKQFFKLLQNDLMCHYPHGRLFEASDIQAESERFAQKLVSPTGLLPGSRVNLASGDAGEFESKIHTSMLDGSRRYAWIFLENCTHKYIPETAHFEISFDLPKGSYATVVLAELAREFNFRSELND